VSNGTGSEILKRMAAPMIGGIFTSFILELFVYPPIYAVWRESGLKEEPVRDQIIVPGHLATAQAIGADATL